LVFRFSSTKLLYIMPHWVPPVPLCSASQGEKSFAYESTGAFSRITNLIINMSIGLSSLGRP
jgi:hypothetical protein